MNAQAKVQPTIRHESCTDTDQDHVFSFHVGPHLIISGEVIERSDYHGLIACPAHNKFFSVYYDFRTNQIETESSLCLLDITTFPSGKDRKVFLNVSLNQQNSPDFDENKLESFTLWDERLADRLSYLDHDDYQGTDRDATFYFDGEILEFHQDSATECGADHNYENAAVLLKLNPNEDFSAQYAVLHVIYGVPSKHINDVDNFYAPHPEVLYHEFNSLEEFKAFQGELETHSVIKNLL